MSKTRTHAYLNRYTPTDVISGHRYELLVSMPLALLIGMNSPLHLLLSFFFIFSLASVSAFAQMAQPARTIKEVTDSAAVQKTMKVATARIVIADYELIRQDFPHLHTASNGEIDVWLLENVAFISKEQALQTKANTQVQTAGESTAFRPPDYKRALVFQVPGGLIDGKGFGAVNPNPGDHSDGLATLGEAMREYLYQNLVQRVFDDSGTGLKTVGSYAVLDWGFKVKHADGSTSPAGAILRQAHQRYKGKYSLFDDEKTKKIELILRKYGLTSAGAYRGSASEQLNVQGTSTNEVIDFGGLLAVQTFSKNATAFYGSTSLLKPGTADFIQPDPKVRVPLEIWGTSISGVEDPKQDNVWLWSHEFAAAFASGTANRHDAWVHFQNLIAPVETKFHSASMKRCSNLFVW